MRIERPREVERFGAIRLGDLQKVFELDSGMSDSYSEENSVIQRVPYEALYEVQKNMAIVVPVRSERLKLIEGVLCGIPHQCLTIVVSNSPRAPVDRFNMEKDALASFCMFVDKEAVIAHQKDPHLSQAFEKTGYTSILDEKGQVRDGKAEGMIIATMLAWLAGKKYIGFIDADNYFPGAVEEYIREYAAALYMSRSPYSMVRIAWHSKPKIVESKLFFRKWGRCTASTNRWLNQLLSHYVGFESEIIKTGNAGEHAMTLDLATRLNYSAGYSIEPYHFLDLFEQFGGVVGDPDPKVMKAGVEIHQIESRNPHLHEAGDDAHIDAMTYAAMQVIYHSRVCPERLKKEILKEMVRKKFLPAEEVPAQPHTFPPLSSIERDRFNQVIEPTSYADVIKKKPRQKLSILGTSRNPVNA